MTPAFILAQMAGLVALVILIISFREKAMARLLNLQIFSSLAYALQYFLLGAYSGLFKCLTCVVRNFIFSRYGKQRPPAGVEIRESGRPILSCKYQLVPRKYDEHYNPAVGFDWRKRALQP